MVSTRRSRSMTAAEDGSTDGPGETAHASQAEVSSRTHGRAAATPKQVPAHLQPVQEEAAAAPKTAAAVEEQQQVAEEQHQAAAQRPRRHQQPQRHSLQQQEQQTPQLHAATAAAATKQQKGPSAAAAASPDSESDKDGEAAGSDDDDVDECDDWDFDGPDMLQNLAATIQSALGTSSTKHPKSQQHRAPAAADDADTDMLSALQWRPQTGLQLPHRVAQVVAAAHQQQQRGEAAAAGPVVHNPAAAAGAAEEAVDAQAAAAAEDTAVATKLKGLAKQLPIMPSKDSKKGKKRDGPETAGKKWYDLPAVEITDEVKRDLRLLRLRGAYDPKRFYKSFDETKFPKHFAIGTVVDDPLDFYGGRLTQGQRKATLTEQLLADPDLNTNRKKRYSKLQDEAQKWVKHKKRKTSQPRKQPSKHRPKH